VEGPSRRERSERRDSDVHGARVRMGYFRDSVRNPYSSVRSLYASVRDRILGVFLYIYLEKTLNR
jgi:hypothetical protein